MPDQHDRPPHAPSTRRDFVAGVVAAAAAVALTASPLSARERTKSTDRAVAPAVVGAYLQVTLRIAPADRPAAAAAYQRYKAPFLRGIPGAQSKQLLVRDEDVQVLHGFRTTEQASAYLRSALFTSDVVVALQPLLQAAPEVRIYATR